MTRFAIVLFLLLVLAGGAALLSAHRILSSRLSVRIAVLILLAGPVALFILIGFNGIVYGAFHTSTPWWSRVLQLCMLVLGGPLVLGLLAARFVNKPMTQFNKAIASLKESNYQIELEMTGIREFDRVFIEF